MIENFLIDFIIDRKGKLNFKKVLNHVSHTRHEKKNFFSHIFKSFNDSALKTPYQCAGIKIEPEIPEFQRTTEPLRQHPQLEDILIASVKAWLVKFGTYLFYLYVKDFLYACKTFVLLPRASS